MEVDGLPLTVMPFDLISMSQADVHTWPNCGEITSKILWKYCIRPVFRLTACCYLNLWPQNLISTCMNPKSSVTKTGWSSLQWFLRYGVHKVFGMHRHTHSLTTDGQTWIQNITGIVFHQWQTHKKEDQNYLTVPDNISCVLIGREKIVKFINIYSITNKIN